MSNSIPMFPYPIHSQLLPMRRSLPTAFYRVPSSFSTDCCQCSHSKRMLASLLFVLLLSRLTVFAASPSSSFGISAPVPLAVEALSLLGDGGWTRNAGRNVSERHPTSSTPSVGTSTAKQSSNHQSAELCDQLHLTARQKQMCVQEGEGLAETLLEAIRMSVFTCQQEFEYERWNCSLHGHSRMLTLKKAYRETAALYAFSAAGIAHAVARACAAGRLRKCHCAEADNELETRQTWRWGGCGDNLAYGRAFAAKFLDAGSSTKVRPISSGGKSEPRLDVNSGSKPNKKKKPKADLHAEMEIVSRALRRWRRTIATNTAVAFSGRMRKMPPETVDVGKFAANEPRPPADKGKASGKKHKNESQRQPINRHNNAVGMQTVEQLVNRTCKCHGVSGSCSVKTCWHQLADFSKTAAVLKDKYDNAVQVNVEIRENSSHVRKTSSASKNQERNRILPQGRSKKNSDHVLMMYDDEPKVMRNSRGESAAATERVSKKELIYQQKSPDFCMANPLGPGTTDRECIRGENCDILCCGRGYNVHRMTVTKPCKCKLILCCRVECQNCLEEVTIHTCK